MSINRLLRANEVLNALGIRKSTLYLRINERLFPTPIKLGRHSLWPVLEVQQIINAHISSKSDLEIKEIVDRMIETRTNSPIFKEAA